jgi:4-amino-4-deoxy-L-arabinose transferase-like glycosyltransferase
MEQREGAVQLPDGSAADGFPRSLAAVLPYVWSRMLFPGTAPATQPWRWDALVPLLVLPAVLLYPCLAFSLFEPDEGRYAEIPREMLARGEWVVPYLHGEPYLDKPPLLYWLVICCYRVLGVQDWVARLVPALAVHSSILLTYLLGRRSLGERAAFWGALALTLAPGFSSMGRLLLLDGVLAALVLTALLSAFEAVRTDTFSRRWWGVAALAAGLGVLAKGPVAVLLVAPPLALHRRLSGRGVAPSWRAWAVFAAVVLAVALPWYAAVCARMPDFARYFLWEHNVVRFLTPFDHQRPIWFYGPIVVLGLFPACLLLVPFCRFLASGDRQVMQRRSPELGFLLLAGGWCVFFFSLSGCKLPTYVLPAFPPLCLALGAFVAATRWARARRTTVFAGIGLIGLAVAHHVAVPWYARYHSPMRRPHEVRAWCSDPATPVVCYPRSVDSVAFYVGREDFRSYRSKETSQLIHFLRMQKRVTVLFSHRHSLEQLRQVLPPELNLVKSAPLGLCAMAVVERRVLPPGRSAVTALAPALRPAVTAD